MLQISTSLRPSPSDIMNISFDKMKAFTMHSLRFYLLGWASSSVWDSYMWSGDSADSWQLCTSAHCSLLAEVKLKDRMIKRCRGLVEVPRCWCKGKVWLRMCLTSCLKSLRFALSYKMDCVMQVALLANLRQCSSSLVSFKANRVIVGHQMIPLNCILSSWIWPQDIMWQVITLIALPCVWWKCIGQTVPPADWVTALLVKEDICK